MALVGTYCSYIETFQYDFPLRRRGGSIKRRGGSIRRRGGSIRRRGGSIRRRGGSKGGEVAQ